MTNYIILFGIAFIVGVVIGLFLFDVLITRPMIMQVMKEHQKQFEKEKAIYQSYTDDYKKEIKELRHTLAMTKNNNG